MGGTDLLLNGHWECKGCLLIVKRISFQLDKEGRYLILSGTLQNVKCVLVNMYAPNAGQAILLTSLCPLLSELSDLPMIVGGDWRTLHLSQK